MHVRLTLIASLAAAVLALGPATASAGAYDYLVAPMTQCGGSQQTNTGLSTATQERIMFCMHNYARIRAGRAGYRGNSLLQTSSDAKTGDMIRCRSFSHTACGRQALFHVKRGGIHEVRQLVGGREHRVGIGQPRQRPVDHVRVGQLHRSPREHSQPQVQGSRRRAAQGNLSGLPELAGVDDAPRLPLLLRRRR